MAKSPPVENLLPQFAGSMINYLQQWYWSGQLLVAGDNTQLRTMSQEIVGQIAWPLPPPTLMGNTPWVPLAPHKSTLHPSDTMQPPSICGHSMYRPTIQYGDRKLEPLLEMSNEMNK